MKGRVKHRYLCAPTLCASIALLGMALSAHGQTPGTTDWPQWRGPDRSGRSTESGLLESWPDAGPERVWFTQGLGSGYGSMAIVGDRVYMQMLVGRRSAVAALNVADGRLVWSRVIGEARGNDRGPGPRSTPTLDAGRVYVLTENGDLACLNAGDGSIIWQRNVLDEFGGRNLEWLISESPLVDDDRVYVTPGGNSSGVIALDKMTGQTIWTSDELSDAAGYASLIVAEVEGPPGVPSVRTLMTLTSRSGVGVRASDGQLMWRYDGAANRTANATTPVFHDNKVFFSSSYSGGGGLVSLISDGQRVHAEEIYHTRTMENHHGGLIYVDGYLYGFHNSILTCLDFETGERMWRDRSVGKGSVAYADGHLYILGERNVVGLVEANPSEYVEKGRFDIEDQGLSSWAHPVISNGRLYIRNQGTVAAYDIRTP
jgi:outer membrane protein assembly factor BamB